MTPSIEEIVGKLEHERAIPGTRPGEAGKVRYVSFGREADTGKAYREVIMKVTPPLMKNGGVVLDGSIVTTPDGTRFYPLVLNGDIEGWQRQIEQGARELELITAHISDQAFHLSDGRAFALSECSVELG